MKCLVDYEVITNETFYRCWHILDYIAAHPNLPELEKSAIQATIMDALVYKKQIDPKKQSLDWESLSIVDNQDGYCYEEHPNICGIPLWMKEVLRHKTPAAAHHIPVTLFLARPPVSGPGRYCVYDPNRAVSSMFDDVNFIEATYISPTRGIEIDKSRPFVEVDINGELYLVDILTKRILKSNWFKDKFNMKVIASQKVSEMEPDYLQFHKEQIDDSKCELAAYIEILDMLLFGVNLPELAERNYELEQSKINYPEEWEKSELLKKEREEFFSNMGYKEMIKQMKVNSTGQN